jgi:hypothetical protein
MGQIADCPLAAGDPQLRAVDTIVRALEEALQHFQLIEDFHRRGMDSVAAEIAEEIGVLFEHLHPAAGSCEQQPGHHPRRSAAADDEVEV